MSRRILFLIILSLAIVVAAALFSVSKNKKPPPAPVTSPTPTPVLTAPIFPDTSDEVSPPQYDVSEISGSFPSSVGIFQALPQQTNSETARIGQAFGLTAPSSTTTGPNGTYTIWQEGLIIGPGLTRLTYTKTLTKGSALGESDLVFFDLTQQLAQKFLRFTTFTRSVPLYFSPRSGDTDLNFVSRSQATAIQTGLLPTIEGLPVISGNPKESEVVARYTGQRELFYISSPLYPPFEKTKDKASIVSLQTAATRLLMGQSSLLFASSESDVNKHNTERYVFSISKITKVELMYFFDTSTSILSPIFLFTGKATDTQTNSVVDTMTAVSALP